MPPDPFDFYFFSIYSCSFSFILDTVLGVCNVEQWRQDACLWAGVS